MAGPLARWSGEPVQASGAWLPSRPDRHLWRGGQTSSRRNRQPMSGPPRHAVIARTGLPWRFRSTVHGTETDNGVEAAREGAGMRMALGRAVRLARNWNRRRGGSGPLTGGEAEAHPSLRREGSVEDWARLGGGLFASDLAEHHRSATLAQGLAPERGTRPMSCRGQRDVLPMDPTRSDCRSAQAAMLTVMRAEQGT